MSKIAMISQPMRGKTDAEIVADRNRAISWLHENGFTVVNTLFTDEWYSKESMEKRKVTNIPLCFLAKSIENMSKVDTVFFVDGWRNARGCQVKHFAAKTYGLNVIYEKE